MVLGFVEKVATGVGADGAADDRRRTAYSEMRGRGQVAAFFVFLFFSKTSRSYTQLLIQHTRQLKSRHGAQDHAENARRVVEA